MNNKSKDGKDSFKEKQETTHRFDCWGYYKFSNQSLIRFNRMAPQTYGFQFQNATDVSEIVELKLNNPMTKEE